MYSHLDIEIANGTFLSGDEEQRKNMSDIGYMEDYKKNCMVNCDDKDWTNELKGLIIKLLKYPETTHCNPGSPLSDSDNMGWK